MAKLWLGKHPVTEEGHGADLDASAALHEFEHHVPREQAEELAYKAYKQKHHEAAAAYHHSGVRGANAAGNSEEARKHGLHFAMHMRAAGHDPLAAVPEHIRLQAEDPKGSAYKFSNHAADGLLDQHLLGKSEAAIVSAMTKDETPSKNLGDVKKTECLLKAAKLALVLSAVNAGQIEVVKKSTGSSLRDNLYKRGNRPFKKGNRVYMTSHTGEKFWHTIGSDQYKMMRYMDVDHPHVYVESDPLPDGQKPQPGWHPLAGLHFEHETPPSWCPPSVLKADRFQLLDLDEHHPAGAPTPDEVLAREVKRPQKMWSEKKCSLCDKPTTVDGDTGDNDHCDSCREGLQAMRGQMTRLIENDPYKQTGVERNFPCGHSRPRGMRFSDDCPTCESLTSAADEHETR